MVKNTLLNSAQVDSFYLDGLRYEKKEMESIYATYYRKRKEVANKYRGIKTGVFNSDSTHRPLFMSEIDSLLAQ